MVTAARRREKVAKEHFSRWFASQSLFRSLEDRQFPRGVFRETKGQFDFHAYYPDFVDRRVEIPQVTIGELTQIHLGLVKKAVSTRWK